MTTRDLRQHLSAAAIVPILSAGGDDPLARADALVEHGATVIEVLFRHPGAAALLAAIGARHPGLLLAAGTILDAEGAARAVAAGADVMVSPGFSPTLHAAAQGAGLPLIPGVNTASEVQHARELGYPVQKFYPAWDYGHQRLPEFHAIYPDVSFLVTGALTSAQVLEFARHPNVAALGGTWMLRDATALATDRARFRAARSGCAS